MQEKFEDIKGVNLSKHGSWFWIYLSHIENKMQNDKLWSSKL